MKTLLNQTQLNVSINNIFPFCNIIRKNGKIQIQFSVEFELLELLKRKFNFQVNLIDGKDAWGSQENGSWTGVIGHVLYGKSHFAMCAITQTPARLEVVDFTSCVYQNGITFVSQKSRQQAFNWIVSRPFDNSIWTLILVSFIVLFGTFYLLSKRKMTHISLKLYAILLGHSYQYIWNESRSALRCILGIWMFTSLILSQAYTSSLYSTLTIPKAAQPIDTAQELMELANSDKAKILTLDHSSYLNDFKAALPSNQVLYSIGKHINRTKNQMILQIDDQLSLVDRDPNVIVISGRIFFMKRINNYRRLHIAQENIGNEFFGLVIPKKSPLLKPFNLLITRTKQMGIIDRCIRKSFFGKNMEGSTSTKSGNQVKIFAFRDLQSIYVVWLLGKAAAFAVFLYEVISKCIFQKI